MVGRRGTLDTHAYRALAWIRSFYSGRIAFYDPEVGALANKHPLSLAVPHDYVVTREGYELPIPLMIFRIIEFRDTLWA
jgi:hypothetical protein